MGPDSIHGFREVQHVIPAGRHDHENPKNFGKRKKKDGRDKQKEDQPAEDTSAENTNDQDGSPHLDVLI